MTSGLTHQWLLELQHTTPLEVAHEAGVWLPQVEHLDSLVLKLSERAVAALMELLLGVLQEVDVVLILHSVNQLVRVFDQRRHWLGRKHLPVAVVELGLLQVLQL